MSFNLWIGCKKDSTEEWESRLVYRRRGGGGGEAQGRQPQPVSLGLRGRGTVAIDCYRFWVVSIVFEGVELLAIY
jgi:hypothetical protein